MSKSILLLIERKSGGKGPEVPVRQGAQRLVVEGVTYPDFVYLHITGQGRQDTFAFGAGTHPICIEAGCYVRAELVGENSLATVLVE